MLWTPLPIEIVLAGWGDAKPNLTQIDMQGGGGRFVLIDSASGQNRVWRVVSTDPYDYMRPELSPGELWAPRGERA